MHQLVIMGSVEKNEERIGGCGVLGVEKVV